MEPRNSSPVAVGNGSEHSNPDEKGGSSCVGLDEDQKFIASPSSSDRATREGEEDSTARTIKFLRARLLSERSVSKAARQKAQQLAQKVLELERQLEIVVEQRKEAEEATQQAVAMLENGGGADYLEAFDSGTDQYEAACEFKSNATSFRLSSTGEDDETSTMGSGSEKALQITEIRIAEQQGLERLHHMHRGLSWQTRANSQSQHEKDAEKTFQTWEQMYLRKSHSGGASVSDAKSGSKRRIGKSCRQIKRRETRPVTEEKLRVQTACSEHKTKKSTEPTLEVFSPSEHTETVEQFCELLEVTLEKDFARSTLIGDHKTVDGNCSSQVAEEGDDIDLKNDQLGEQTSGEECTARVHPEHCTARVHPECSVPYPSEDKERQIESGSDKEMEMERVLEQRAELIDQYEAEENAQREWEEKFRELNCSSEQSMDSCKHEKQTRETEEEKEQQGTCFNREKNVTAMLNSEKNEETDRIYQPTSEKSCILHSEKFVCSHSHEVHNETMHEMNINESDTCQVHGSLPPSTSNTSCRLICSCGVSSLYKAEAIQVERVPVINEFFIQDIHCAETMSEQQKQGKLQSDALNFVMGLQASDKEVAKMDFIAKSSDKAAENIVELYCEDIGPNPTEKAIPVLEKHIPVVAHVNKFLESSAPVVHDKALDAMHTLKYCDDATESLPDNVHSTNEMMNSGSMAEALESREHCTDRKMVTRDYESSGSEVLMLATGEKPQDVSLGSYLRNSKQIATDSIPKECRGYSQSWHASCNNGQVVPLMQGFHRIDPVANATCPSMHPHVSVKSVKYIPMFEMVDVQMQQQKKNQEHFDRAFFHDRESTSDINLRTMAQENMKGRPFNGQPDKSTDVNESKVSIMEDFTLGPATPNSRAVGFQMPCHGFRSSSHLDGGNSALENYMNENRLSRPPFSDSSHAIMNKIETSLGSHESYASLKESGTDPQRTYERNDYSFQKQNSRLDTNNWSGHGISSNHKDHSTSLFVGQLVIPTAENADSSHMREFEPSFQLHAGKNAREESDTYQINQSFYGYGGRVQLGASHKSNSSRDVLMALQLAKLQLHNILDNTQSVIQHPNIRASSNQDRDPKEMQSCSFVEAPFSCTELFRLPSKVDCKLPSEIRVSRPYLPDFNHGILVEVPNNCSSNVSGRERPSLHIKQNPNDVDLSRSQWPPADNQNVKQIYNKPE